MALGCARERAEEAGNEGESERVGLRDVHGVLRQLQAIGGKQEVAMHVCARRGHTPLSSWRGGDDDWHCQSAGPACWVAGLHSVRLHR